jgi:hypothetical protein
LPPSRDRSCSKPAGNEPQTSIPIGEIRSRNVARAET